MLPLRLNTAEARPIYAQIGEQITFGIASGALPAGTLVPSVRELSRQLVVNPNTVARAYRDLQSEGVLETVRGTGLQVTADAPERCRAGRRDLVRRRLREAIEEAHRSALGREEIDAMIREEWARSNGHGPTGGDR